MRRIKSSGHHHSLSFILLCGGLIIQQIRAVMALLDDSSSTNLPSLFKILPLNSLTWLHPLAVGDAPIAAIPKAPTDGSAKKPEEEKLQLVPIPLLRTVATSHGETGDNHVLLQDAPVESMIAAPKDWCPQSIYDCSMSPLISDGYILVSISHRIISPSWTASRDRMAQSKGLTVLV